MCGISFRPISSLPRHSMPLSLCLLPGMLSRFSLCSLPAIQATSIVTECHSVSLYVHSPAFHAAFSSIPVILSVIKATSIVRNIIPPYFVPSPAFHAAFALSIARDAIPILSMFITRYTSNVHCYGMPFRFSLCPFPGISCRPLSFIARPDRPISLRPFHGITFRHQNQRRHPYYLQHQISRKPSLWIFLLVLIGLVFLLCILIPLYLNDRVLNAAYQFF